MNKSTLFQFLRLLPLNNTIMFESKPDFSDNTKAVFDEMLRRGLNKKYKFVWLHRNEQSHPPKQPNVTYVSYTDPKRILYRATCKCLICCNSWLKTMRPGQSSFYLSHGTPIKSIRSYYSMPSSITHCLAAGEGAVPILMHEFNIPMEKITVLGFPRNDVLTSPAVDLHPFFPDRTFQKVLVWYPTFRQRPNGLSVSSHPFPIITDDKKAELLNETAKQLGILIVLKPHFVQDTRYISDLNLSNICLIDDSFFVKNKISSYRFVGSCDALITDYSSIYYDYLLCDKPIALLWDDYDEYKRLQGFAPGAEAFLSGGEKVYTLEEFQTFLREVAAGHDKLKQERNQICSLVNYARDGKNAERVVDFIVETAKL